MENQTGKNTADLDSGKIQSRTTHRESKGEQHGRWNRGHVVVHEVWGWVGKIQVTFRQYLIAFISITMDMTIL